MYSSPSYTARPALLPTCTPCGSLGNRGHASLLWLHYTLAHSQSNSVWQMIDWDQDRRKITSEFACSYSCSPPFILPPSLALQHWSNTGLSQPSAPTACHKPSNLQTNPCLRVLTVTAGPCSHLRCLWFSLPGVLWFSFCCCTTFCLSLYLCSPSLNWENSQDWI